MATKVCSEFNLGEPLFFKTTTIYNLNKRMVRLGGVVVTVLATGPQGCRFKTWPRRWIFKGDKNPQHTFLSDGK
jgi:hypothetical protein